LGVLILLAYLAVAFLAWRGVARIMPPGLGRAVVRGLVAAQFLSVTLVVGHGAAPAPILPLLLSCPVGLCTDLYGKGGWISWLLLPLVIQTAIGAAIGAAFHGVLTRWLKRRRA
jgi:hypothetical protein